MTSRYEFCQLLTNYAEPLKKAVKKKSVKVRVVLEVSEHEDSMPRFIDEYKSSGSSFDLKYAYQASSHLIIIDHKQALVATSPEPPIGESPYLWTDDNNLVGLLQTYFESIWHVTEEVSEEALLFVKRLRPTNHVIFLYDSLEAKHNVLFNYLKVGLENGEAALYVASEESPGEIRDAMKRFGIDVEEKEKTGALRILEYSDFYIIDGKFDIETTKGFIRKMYDEAMAKGFKGWRGTGEMVCFLEHDLIQELTEYERALHRVLDVPIIAVCAYNTNMLTKFGNPINLYSELVRAHGTVLFTGVGNKLGRIEIRKA